MIWQITRMFWLMFVAMAVIHTPMSFGEDDPESFFMVKSLNTGLSKADANIDLHTPRSTLEHFLDHGRNHKFQLASHALNLNAFSPSDQKNIGSVFAEQLYYVLNQKLQIDWSKIPDRPDGTLDIPLDSTSPLAGKPRRSIRIGSVPLENREVEFRLDRYQPQNSDPQWLFSQRTVNKIPHLYAEYGPGPLLEYLPPKARRFVLKEDPIWQIPLLAAISVIALALGLSINWLVMRLFAQSSRKYMAETANQLRNPLGLFLILIILDFIIFSLISFSGPLISHVGPLLNTLIIISITWLTIRLTEVVTDISSYKYTDRIITEGERHARQMTTHISVARRVIIFLTLVLAAGFALRQFQMFETLSLSLLASAGVASVILGVAAHSVLGNIMAGMQVAITQPACIGDAVQFEEHWGYIEDITYTYITIRTWDLRRVVVPLSYFIAHPFENWSMKDAHLIKPIYVYVDYRTDVGKLRKKFEEILESSSDWDRNVPPAIQVTGLTENTMELRALCSAKDSLTAWNLHCRLREQLVAFLQEFESGRFLPKQRMLVETENMKTYGSKELQE